MATHSSVLAWRIPGTGVPGGLPSMGSHRVRHDWSDLAATLNLCQIIRVILWGHIFTYICYIMNLWELPGDSVVKTSPSNAGGVGLIPAWGVKIPRALWQKKQHQQQKQYCNKFNKCCKKKKMVHTKQKRTQSATETHPRNQGRVPNFSKSQNILFLGPGLWSSLLKYWKGQTPLCSNCALISPLMVFIAYKEQRVHEDTTHGQCPVNKRAQGGQPVSTRRLVFSVSNSLLICVGAAINGVSTFVTGDVIFVQVIGTIIQ